MTIGSIIHPAQDVPSTAAQQKADLERLTAQHDRRTATGTAESTAALIARAAQSAAAGHGVNVTLSSAAQTINKAAAQALAANGATFQPGALATPSSIGAQKGDLGEASTEYHHLQQNNALETGVISFRQAAVDVVG